MMVALFTMTWAVVAGEPSSASPSPLRVDVPEQTVCPGRDQLDWTLTNTSDAPVHLALIDGLDEAPVSIEWGGPLDVSLRPAVLDRPAGPPQVVGVLIDACSVEGLGPCAFEQGDVTLAAKASLAFFLRHDGMPPGEGPVDVWLEVQPRVRPRPGAAGERVRLDQTLRMARERLDGGCWRLTPES